MTRGLPALACLGPCLGLCLGLLGAGCTDGVTPRLSAFYFDGQAPDSTSVILLSVHFQDDDGDLGEGSLETFIGGRATSRGAIPLLPIFIASGVDLEATEGDLGFDLELTFPADESTWPKDGAVFQLGARVVDQQGNTSSTEQVSLRLTFDQP